MAIQRLDQILRTIIGWEKRLLVCYENMEQTMHDVRSKGIVVTLKERQIKHLKVFDSINMDEYKDSEFIKNLPEYTIKENYCQCEISNEASGEEIMYKVLMYEEEIEKYYKHLRDVLVYTQSKDLFDMLIQFKMGQIKEIKALMDNSNTLI